MPQKAASEEAALKRKESDQNALEQFGDWLDEQSSDEEFGIVTEE